MKILVLTWEFPPRIVGGIARHVGELYPELVKLGHVVQLITVQFGDLPLQAVVEGIQVHRVTVGQSQDFFHWVGQMNQAIGAYAAQLIHDEGPFDLVHAHDWLVGDSAIALKHHFKLPLVATIHATEHGRNRGIHNHVHQHVHHQEHTLTYEAWRVIVCTNYMRQELHTTLQLPLNKVDVIYNGIRSEKKPLVVGAERQTFRRRFAQDDEAIVYYVGRMAHEKGIARLVEAAPQVLDQMQGKVKFVIVGGGNTVPFQRQVQQQRLGPHFTFTGFLPDAELDVFQTIADCAVFPSLYEPFGIVALESFAARVPVVVSDAGGLPEVVQHQETGIVTRRDDPTSIAAGILQVLNHPQLSAQLVENAYQDLNKRFRWDQIAVQTQAVYEQVLTERRDIDW
ncbi:glycosyltransferase family 4 protein [filamentous cyanobacterium LEGE 11480]|uniref:Glycosyltransferase family 4 protein n=1 Tax=Romeriopsis navalis LEGE 11480 TaxID=2777977 RepID=A0A928Z669_9CYAN|nr:glycosyltransferase family 4 protein [Romeriopsis navalis]MBE9032732.1 glycosyltransferase family 4 protein [Romeriopsis navalis LEGE 11480]